MKVPSQRSPERSEARLRELESICERVVRLRGQGWQKRQEMHEAISELGVLLGIGPHPTGPDPTPNKET